MVTLSSQAIANIPADAQQHIIDHAPFETYSTVSYTGNNGGTIFNGMLVEVTPTTWVENNLFHFNEVSETDTQVVLYDPSRALTLTLNYLTDDLAVSFDSTTLHWAITGVTESLTPVIPDGWIV
jgi:hypothetical protein